MEAFVTAGAGFLLAVLWFDLMFDVQVRGTVTDEAIASISAYYRRVTTDARPMNRFVAVAMLATVIAIVAELTTDRVAAWVGWVSLGLAVVAMSTAALRTVPRAVRLGANLDPADEQARMARRILHEHVLCFLSIGALIAVQLTHAA